MKCDHVELHLADDLRGGLPAELKAEIEAHLAGCERCFREVASLRRVWGLMENPPGAEASAADRLRLEETIRAYQLGLEDADPSRRPQGRSRVLGYAAAGILLLVGIAAGFMMSGGGGASKEGARYLLLVYEPPAFRQRLTPSETARLDEAYEVWWEDLHKSDRLVGWMRVASGGGHSLKRSGEVEEILPLLVHEATEDLGWVAVVQAVDAEEAAAIARGCPALSAGARVEIHPEELVRDGPLEDPA